MLNLSEKFIISWIKISYYFQLLNFRLLCILTLATFCLCVRHYSLMSGNPDLFTLEDFSSHWRTFKRSTCEIGILRKKSFSAGRKETENKKIKRPNCIPEYLCPNNKIIKSCYCNIMNWCLDLVRWNLSRKISSERDSKRWIRVMFNFIFGLFHDFSFQVSEEESSLRNFLEWKNSRCFKKVVSSQNSSHVIFWDERRRRK